MAHIALFALAVLQLGFVLHHDQHSATDLAGTCPACVQLEQFDDAAGNAAAAIAVTPGELTPAAPAVRRGTATSLRAYASRAPPASA